MPEIKTEHRAKLQRLAESTARVVDPERIKAISKVVLGDLEAAYMLGAESVTPSNDPFKRSYKGG